MMVNREFDDLDVKALGDVVCLEVYNHFLKQIVFIFHIVFLFNVVAVYF